MARAEDDIDAAAIAWLLRTGEPDFAEWEAFAAWLEADPIHAARYHRLHGDADDLAGAIAPAAPIVAPRPARPDRRRWLAGGLAAALVGIVGYGAMEGGSGPRDTYVVETAPGVTRTIRLGDGSSVALNGGTRLTLDRTDERMAVLEQGEALFTVRHDAARPFRVTVGQDEVVDVGTVFDVVRSDGKTWVGVSEGAILFNPREEAVHVPAGRSLRSDDAAGTVELADVAMASVGAWTAGRLDFTGAPLAEVAAALSRALGTHFTVAPALATRTFRGTIALADARRDPAVLAALLDVRMRRTKDGWEIAARP